MAADTIVHRLRKAEIPKELVEAFDKELVKTDYQGLKFVDPIHYFNRLIDLVGIYFSYKIKQEYISEEKAVMVVVSIGFQLEDGTWIWKEGNSAKEIYNETKNGLKKISGGIGYAAKIAASNATKRALLLLGIGKELYDDQDHTEYEPSSSYTKKSDTGYKNYSASSDKPISENQISYILKLKAMNRVTDQGMLSIFKTCSIPSAKTPQTFNMETLKVLNSNDARKLIDLMKDSKSLSEAVAS